MLWEKREEYSLKSSFLVFQKIHFYVLEQTGLVIWLTVYLESIHLFDTKSDKHF